MFKKLIHFKPLFIKQCMHKKRREVRKLTFRRSHCYWRVRLLLELTLFPAVSGRDIDHSQRQRHEPIRSSGQVTEWLTSMTFKGQMVIPGRSVQASSFWTISSWRHTPRHSASAMYKWQSWEREKMSKYIFLLSLNLVSNPLKCCGKCRAVTTK